MASLSLFATSLDRRVGDGPVLSQCGQDRVGQDVERQTRTASHAVTDKLNTEELYTGRCEKQMPAQKSGSGYADSHSPKGTKGQRARESTEKGAVSGIGTKKDLSPQQREELLRAVNASFETHTKRHKGVEWAKVEAKLKADSDKLWSLNQMETTGGEPDVVGHDKQTAEYIFYDCSAESPKGRRSVCYDGEALESRKEHKPKNSAIDLATAMGVELLTEEQYRELQGLGEFDTKTSSWVHTPTDIRELGGALFCDRRYDHVFVYHNGAESYNAARAFRGSLRV